MRQSNLVRTASALTLATTLLTAETPMFPTLQGRDLERKEVILPNDLEGRRNLVLFGFVRAHQEAIDTWIPKCLALQDEVDGLRCYEVPFISGFYQPVRGFIDNGMRRGIPDPAARRRTITVYGGRKKALRQLGISDTDTIWAVLVDAEGKVVWRRSGSWSVEKEQELREALDQLPATQKRGE